MPRKPESSRDAGSIAGDIERGYRANRRRLLKALNTLDAGTSGYVRTVEALQKLDESYRRERAARGIDPADIGLAARPSGFHFVCFTGSDGAVTTKEVPADRIKAVLEQRATQHRQRMKKVMDDPERRRVLPSSLTWRVPSRTSPPSESSGCLGKWNGCRWRGRCTLTRTRPAIARRPKHARES